MTTATYYTPSGRSIQASGISPDVEMKFVPPAEESGETADMIREKDLKGHMHNDQEPQAETEKTDEEKEDEKRVKMLIEKDNQVRGALQLLQTWNIFSQMKLGS